MPPIYGYLDYRQYLSDAISRRIAQNPNYSIRAFAKNIGLSSTVVNRILNGHRNITEMTMPRFMTGLRLSAKECEYFELLVDFNQAKAPQMRRISLDHIMNFRRLRLRRIKPTEYEYYNEWYHSVVREVLTMVPAAESGSAQVARMLTPEISARAADQSIRLLQGLGLVAKGKHGNYFQTASCLTTGMQWESSIISIFQMRMAELGAQAIERIPKNERDISTLTVSLTPEALERVQARIKGVRDVILAEARAGGNRVYQINFQIFPVSKLIRRKENVKK